MKNLLFALILMSISISSHASRCDDAFATPSLKAAENYVEIMRQRVVWHGDRLDVAKASVQSRTAWAEEAVETRVYFEKAVQEIEKSVLDNEYCQMNFTYLKMLLMALRTEAASMKKYSQELLNEN